MGGRQGSIHAFITFTAKESTKYAIEKLNGLEYKVLLTFIRNLFESPFSLNENLAQCFVFKCIFSILGEET